MHLKHIRTAEAFNSEFLEAIVPLTSFLCGPVDEEIHGSNLSDLLILSVQPEDLLAALPGRLALNRNRRPVVTKKHKATITEVHSGNKTLAWISGMENMDYYIETKHFKGRGL